MSILWLKEMPIKVKKNRRFEHFTILHVFLVTMMSEFRVTSVAFSIVEAEQRQSKGQFKGSAFQRIFKFCIKTRQLYRDLCFGFGKTYFRVLM